VLTAALEMPGKGNLLARGLVDVDEPERGKACVGRLKLDVQCVQ